MNKIQETQNSIMNQIKYNSDNAKDNVLQFQKKAIQNNPYNSLTFHWQLAQVRKNFVFFATLPFVIGKAYWSMWSQVYSPEGKE